MHLPLRRNTKKGSSLPKAAPSPPETSITSGTQKQQHDTLPHDTTQPAQSTSPQSSPQKLKNLGRRMTSFSKPVRMLKSIASRSSLRNQNGSAHGRRPSAVSVHSVASQQEAEEHEREHEPDVKEVRESIDTDYGREIARRSSDEKKSVRSESEEQQAVVKPAVVPREDVVKVENVMAEHEAVARQEEPQAGLVEKKELTARVEEASNDATTSVAAVETATTTAPVVIGGDAKEDAKGVKRSDVEKTSRDPKEATPAEDLPIAVPAPAPVRESAVELEPAPADSVVIVQSQNAETISLSSSSTTVDPPAPLAAGNNNLKADGDASETKVVTVQVKMEQNPEPAKNEEDDDDAVVVDRADSLWKPLKPESQKEQEGTPVVRSDAGTPVAQSVTLSKELESTDNAASLAPSPPPVVEENKTMYAPPPVKTTAGSTDTSSSPKISSSEDEAPELHAPALTVTSLFLPVPQVRTFVRGVISLTWWLTTKAASYPLSYWPGLSTSRVTRFLIHPD